MGEERRVGRKAGRDVSRIGGSRMIKIDLHIHSKASEYKEAKGLVDNSTVYNVDLLLSKLEENKINMFSITDHNRFDPVLHKRIDEILMCENFEYVRQILAGVEFDVQLENEKPRCHIIAIFDAQNKEENYQKIYDAIESKKLVRPQEMYSRSDFESILKAIGLSVILIAHQKCSLDRKKDSNNSLSGATADANDLIFGGYINALEFGKPNQEGIIKNNLKQMNEIAPLLTGSDCHDWSCYPLKDSKAVGEKLFTTLHSLPTFKGLHLALTSPVTRIAAKERKCELPLDSFTVNGITHKLSNGIIAVIGENGSGKSTLLEFFGGEGNAEHQKRIRKANGFKVNPKVDSSKKRLIKQGSIVDGFHDKKLFPNSNFNEVDDSPFKEAYREYGKKIQAYINSLIEFNNALEMLNSCEFEIKCNNAANNYYININNPENFPHVHNKHADPKAAIDKIIKDIKKLLKDEYYSDYQEQLLNIIKTLQLILEEITNKWNRVETEGTVKNLISSAINNYLDEIEKVTSSLDTSINEYINQKTNS